MIGGIRGKLSVKNPPHLLVETVGGVCYEIEAPMSTFYELPELNKDVFLHTHLVVREDAQLLYGFYNETERSMFRLLIKVNGIGPKVALAILSSLSPKDFIQCVEAHDTAMLVKVPGIGKKTAERLLVEMQGRIDSFGGVSSSDLNLPTRMHVQEASPTRDAITALVSLGYKPALASKMVSQIDTDDKTSEDIIRLALKGAAPCQSETA